MKPNGIGYLLLFFLQLAACNQQTNLPQVAKTALAVPLQTEGAPTLAPTQAIITLTPITESPTPTSSPTVEAEPWVDLPVNADIVEKDGWEIPSAQDVLDKNTRFFGILENVDGAREIAWMPYEIDLSKYSTASMFWVENGIDRDGRPGINGALQSMTNHVLNTYYSETAEVGSIAIPPLDATKLRGNGEYIYPSAANFMEGKIHESFRALIEVIESPVVIFIASGPGKEGYIFNRNSELPDGFLDDKGDWSYMIFPFTINTENPFEAFNIISEFSSNLFGRFEYENGELVYYLNPSGWNVRNLLDMDNLGNDFDLNP